MLVKVLAISLIFTLNFSLKSGIKNLKIENEVIMEHFNHQN